MASVIGESIVRNKRLIPTVSIFVITIVKFFGIFMIFSFMDIIVEVDFIKIIIMGLYNSIIMFFMYKMVSRQLDKNNNNQQWKFK